MGPDVTLAVHYDPRLVALSVLLAFLVSYAILDLVGRIVAAQGRSRYVWLFGGAVAAGSGLWTMHHVAMEALILPLDVQYDWRTVGLSLLTCIVTSGLALFAVGRPGITRRSALLGGLLMGSGIAAMHYIGLAAIRIPTDHRHSPAHVVLTVLLSVGISSLALLLAFHFHKGVGSLRRKVLAALLLSAAFSAVHYAGMTNIRFTQAPDAPLTLDHLLNDESLSLSGVVASSLLFLLIVLVTSIVDRRFSHKQQELTESRSQLQAIFDNMAESIIVLDPQGNVLRHNPAADQMFGSEFAAHLPEIWNGYEIFNVTGDPLHREAGPIHLALRGVFVANFELSIRKRGHDKTHYFQVNTAPIRNRAGAVSQIILTHRDVTDLRQITETRARLAAIVDSSEDAIIGKDRNGIVRTWNAAAKKIFGYSAEEMVGQSILKLVPSNLLHEEEAFLARIHNGESIEHVETVRKRKDGKLIQVALTISPIRDSKGQVVGASKTARDITERKQLETQLKQSQKMEAIGQLTGGIAHDFNNLLGVIMGNLDLLERQLDQSDPALRRVHTALKAAARGADLTRRLLSFSRNEQLKPAPTKLQHAIRNMIELAARALGPEIRISTHFDNNIPPVFVDSAALENALLNLAVNARDAMPKGGTLTISTQTRTLEDNYPPVKTGELKPGNYVCVSVSDTGEGMTRETMDRAFEPFFSTKPRGKGTGLGLAMVYGFVRQSGGTVRLYSEVGYGTTVSFYLPLAYDASPVPAPLPTRSEPIHGGGVVLVVDDEPDLLEIACAYLDDMGCQPLSARDGASALEIFDREKHIDLMVTDVIMPGMNGVDLVKQVRQIMPSIKVIYSSGFSADALAERSGTAVDGYLLHKPYQQSEFAAAIRRALKGSEAGAD